MPVGHIFNGPGEDTSSIDRSIPTKKQTRASTVKKKLRSAMFRRIARASTKQIAERQPTSQATLAAKIYSNKWTTRFPPDGAFLLPSSRRRKKKHATTKNLLLLPPLPLAHAIHAPFVTLTLDLLLCVIIGYRPPMETKGFFFLQRKTGKVITRMKNTETKNKRRRVSRAPLAHSWPFFFSSGAVVV